MKKFTINSKILGDKLSYMGGLINPKATLQILECYLFKVDRNRLVIIATDLENTLESPIDLEEDSGTEFEVCLQSKLLTNILKSIPAQPIVFEQNEVMEIKTHSGKFEIPYFETAEFPVLPEVDSSASFKILSGSLMNAISKTLFATAHDELRPILCGVFFELSPSVINFVATDAHRLAMYTITDIDCDFTDNFVVPKKPLSVLKSMLTYVEGEVLISYNKINVVFQTDEFILTCRLPEGNFPNYKAVIPKKNDKKMVIDRLHLKSSVDRVSICSDRQTHQVVLSITSEKVKVESQDLDFSKRGEDSLACVFNEPEFRIGFNAKLFVQMLEVIESNDITIEMSEPIRGAIITPVESITPDQSMKMLIMPVQISN